MPAIIPRVAGWILTGGALLAPGQSAAQNSGLLLGLLGGDSVSAYRTLWIAPVGGIARVIASGPDLLVPRRSGFWRVCLVSGEEVSDGQTMEWDNLVAKPATGARGRCAAPRGEAAQANEQEGWSCRSSADAEILFLGSDAVSIERREESNCGAHYSGGTHAELASLDDRSPLELTSFLPPERRAALLAATLNAGRAEFADIGRVDTLDSEEDTGGPQLRVLREWTVERGAGRWQLVGHAYCSPYVACGDGIRRFSISEFAAPARLVGHDELSPSLARIKAAFPEVRDAVSSPRGDLLVALTGDSLLVFAPRGARLGAPVARLELTGRIVMAQWALGQFVPLWDAELRRLLALR